MKTNLNYYSRRVDAYRHPKFKTLRVTYGGGTEGWAAEGRFWALNDIIAEAEMCQLDLSKLRNKATIAEALGMSFDELDHFIEVLSGPDIELLFEIEPGIFSTKKVRETLDTVLVEREKARNRKGSGEKHKSSGEKMEISDEQNNKVKESKVKENKGKESKVETPLETSFLQTTFSELSTSHFELVRNLFVNHTRIRDPNDETHVKPILNFFTMIPERLTEGDIADCIQEAFAKLSPDKGVMMEFLLKNIQGKITAKHEEVLNADKKPLLKQARLDRIAEKKAIEEENKRFRAEKVKVYKEFLDKNTHLFNELELEQILRLIEKNKLFEAGLIIEPKMETVEL